MRERVLVVAARQSMVDRLVEAVNGAGLKPNGIDLNAFALVRMLGSRRRRRPDRRQRRASCATSAG